MANELQLLVVGDDLILRVLVKPLLQTHCRSHVCCSTQEIILYKIVYIPIPSPTTQSVHNCCLQLKHIILVYLSVIDPFGIVEFSR